MENKKSKDANLENKKFVFFTVGLVMSASLILMAFQYESADIAEKETVAKHQQLEEEFVFDIPEEEIIEESNEQIMQNAANKFKVSFDEEDKKKEDNA